MVKPAGKRPGGDLEMPEPVDFKPKPKAPTAEHEAAETPEYEGQEEYGAKLIQDIEAAGEKHGLDAEQSHAVAASFFKAVADCLSREEEGEAAGENEEEEKY
jgi:hypothetical protein